MLSLNTPIVLKEPEPLAPKLKLDDIKLTKPEERHSHKVSIVKRNSEIGHNLMTD
jgi:hypothetical protein